MQPENWLWFPLQDPCEEISTAIDCLQEAIAHIDCFDEQDQDTIKAALSMLQGMKCD